ncbi:DUF397 domain-containing protein [Streptomyces sp. N2-109]|uniref:DUF397 domain-containing protein n=1 Tax=Streptomyces gossypii TaxID=2883101 RepID=A0ABT2K5K2_9ACTN|nr:DUF397 domain-containing protein [Streptomyces gossypii]MCT2594775.1 DUF397 domain-containing protein [Streptomyces gossypii]
MNTAARPHDHATAIHIRDSKPDPGSGPTPTVSPATKTAFITPRAARP